MKTDCKYYELLPSSEVYAYCTKKRCIGGFDDSEPCKTCNSYIEKGLKENVLSVEKKSSINNQQTNKLVQKNVLISCVEGRVQLHSQGKSYSFANYVEHQNSSHQHIKEEVFVQLLVGINITLKNAIIFGKGGLHQNEQSLIQVKNGKLFVNLFGKGIMQPAKDVKIDLTTLKGHLKFITLNPLSLNNIDLNWITSFSYVINAINGYIQKETKIKSSLNLDLFFRNGWTAEGINEKGEVVKISDTQRYKMCGNAVTTNVIEAIVRSWIN